MVSEEDRVEVEARACKNSQMVVAAEEVEQEETIVLGEALSAKCTILQEQVLGVEEKNAALQLKLSARRQRSCPRRKRSLLSCRRRFWTTTRMWRL